MQKPTLPIALTAYRKWISEVFYFCNPDSETKNFLLRFALRRKGAEFEVQSNRELFRDYIYQFDHHLSEISKEMKREAHSKIMPILTKEDSCLS